MKKIFVQNIFDVVENFNLINPLSYVGKALGKKTSDVIDDVFKKN